MTTFANDLLISQCFKLESNKTYTLEFKYRVLLNIGENECMYRF